MGYVFDAIRRAGESAAEQPVSSTPTSLSEAELAGLASRVTPPVTGNSSAGAPGLPGAPDASAASTDAVSAPAEPARAAGDDAPAEPARAAGDDAPAEPVDPIVLSIAREDVDDRLVSLVDATSQVAEEYRSIRTALLARWEQKRRLVHTITSATPQEGKTITSLNLGLSFAELRNRSTLVVEADLRLPTFAKLLRLDDGPGVVQVLRGEASIDDAIRTLAGTRLRVMAAGESSSREAIQLLSSPRATQLLQTLRQRFDHTIVDTPPVIELADAGILGAQSDEVLLVVRMQRTPRPLVDQALRTLKGYAANVAGVVATDQQHARHQNYYYYGYSYRYRYQAKQAA
jgi:capsular exopolysaccharide synthesis family protein